MARTTIAVREATQGRMLFYNVDEAPPGVNVAGSVSELKLQPTTPAFAMLGQLPLKEAAVRDAGKLIFDTLISHSDMQVTMPVVLATANEEQPIFLFLNSPRVENWPWEALWEKDRRFLALDPKRRWPIGRLALSAARIPRLKKSCQQVIKVTAILAAADVDASPEWDSLYAGVESFGDQLHLQVFVSQDELHDRIRAQPQEAGKPKVSVAYVSELKAILNGMAAFGPNIVHFFCHGSVSDRTTLEIETRNARIADSPTERVIVEASELTTLSELDTLWLAVLNSCKGAEAPRGPSTAKDSSFARGLVESGMPAAVAMREAVVVRDAHVFTKAFYAALLGELETVVLKQWGEDPIDVSETLWVRAVDGARAEILKRNIPGAALTDAAGSCKEWTLPVVYANRAELKLQAHGPTQPTLTVGEITRLRTKLGVLRGTYNLFAYNRAPKNALDSMNEEIAKCESQLYAPLAV